MSHITVPMQMRRYWSESSQPATIVGARGHRLRVNQNEGGGRAVGRAGGTLLPLSRLKHCHHCPPRATATSCKLLQARLNRLVDATGSVSYFET